MALPLLALVLVLVSAAAQTPPGVPSSVELTVVSGDTLELEWEPPISDGGSEVTSYALQWDTSPGSREVQTVKTDVFIGANAVQTITTSSDHVDEVQVIRTTADASAAAYEVQHIRTINSPVGGK